MTSIVSTLAKRPVRMRRKAERSARAKNTFSLCSTSRGLVKKATWRPLKFKPDRADFDEAASVERRDEIRVARGTGLGPLFRKRSPGQCGSEVMMAYWLFKSEPSVFSFADLMAAPDRRTGWDGVRNHQARNFLRDQIRVGDRILFYHSNADPPAIVGLAKVTRAGHPDPTAFEPGNSHFDPKSDPARPTWYQVEIEGIVPIEPPLGLSRLRGEARLEGMELLRKGSRLSVQPVSPEHFEVVMSLAGLDREVLGRKG